MSFRLGGYDTAAIQGVTATLKAWPAPVYRPETVELPDGAFYARTGRGALQFEFDVLLRGVTPAAVHALRDQLLQACSPTAGLQALTPETGAGWIWWAAVASVSEFKRGLWLNGVECQLVGAVEFLVPDGVGWAAPDETVTAGGTTVTMTRAKGNLPSHPRIAITGTFAEVALQAGASTLKIATPLATGQTLVLDYQELDFGIWDGPTKVRHIANAMSAFDRLTLDIGQPTTFTATPTGGTVASVSVAANSRRA